MTISFELIDIIIFIGICQGIFLSLTLQRITNNNKRANTILSLLLIAATVMLLGRFIYSEYLNEWVFLLSMGVDSIIFLFGPLFLMYTSRLLFYERTKKTLPLIHYLPFASILLLFFILLVVHTPSSYWQAFEDGKLKVMFLVISGTALLLNSYYLIRSFLLLKEFKETEKKVFSFEQGPLRYLYAFHLAFALCLLVWWFSYLNWALFNTYFTYLGYDSVWIAISLCIYVIGYFSLKQPELFRIPVLEKVTQKRDRLSADEVRILDEKLNSLMSNERLFLENDLTLQQVALQLKTSTNNVSWLLNKVYRTTFYDYINGYRIKEFVERVKNKEHLQHTILALSMDVGFNSKSTFNKAFKQTMNDTPSNYIKKNTAA
ncbi:helix-turn-helix transcriptional regulator [Rasiella rasia]|uniref:Helix-turn-helix transcriptional regulator n=1 Tax=Rasiella rasia TaxID=2744027 RepID=A0A6G6GML6_9FLAO|nr:AraC family transcriptional regulator [Rasiella rasia]QIE59653.1 helix-turn-helix transcriptional regulator [Rasiella rasia]